MNSTVQYDLSGRRPSDIVASLQFLANAHPNHIMDTTFGPTNILIGGQANGDPDRAAKMWAVISEALVRIQEHVSELLLMPAEMNFEQRIAIVEAAKLLSGEARTGDLTGDFAVHHTDIVLDLMVNRFQ